MLSVYLSLDGGVYPRGVSIAVLVYLCFFLRAVVSLYLLLLLQGIFNKTFIFVAFIVFSLIRPLLYFCSRYLRFRFLVFR